jgi:TetR/AcrR family transcriptional regulator, lmrAB and yxaGH operons repressor
MVATTTSRPQLDTRARLLRAAQRLFRKRGYHATGINEILQLADAPKGSLYHHFPGGKEEIGVHVIDGIAQSIVGLLARNQAQSMQVVIEQFGAELVQVAEKTNFEICALLTAFVAERQSSPKLGLAVAAAYRDILVELERRLELDGMSRATAKEKAILIVALLEGGSLLAQVQQDSTAFKLAIQKAARLCD